MFVDTERCDFNTEKTEDPSKWRGETDDLKKSSDAEKGCFQGRLVDIEEPVLRALTAFGNFWF
jgi:hypothetical protein